MTDDSLLVVEDKSQEHHQSTIPASIDSKSKNRRKLLVRAGACVRTGIQRDDCVRSILHISK
jgi:hypothetical protein